MGRFDGQLALVTGAASGIGAATARMLAAEGAEVVLTDLNDEAGQELAGELGGSYVHLDVADPAAWTEVAAARPYTLGVLNAGIGVPPGDLRQLPDAALARVLDVNVGGVIVGTRELFRAMAGRGGTISVTASIAGIAAHKQSPVYGASKWAVVGWVRAIAPSLAAEGVRINAVCPGLVDTPILGPGGGDRMRAMGLHVMTAEEVAGAHAVALQHPEGGAIFVAQAGQEPRVHEFARVEGYQG